MKILVVEDEHKIAGAIKKGLEHEKYIVDVAYDGNDGLYLAESGDYDLIILDRLLPGMEGSQICAKLREQAVHTPILMLTARGQIEERIEGLDSGADDYMVKPFAFVELFARVRALSRRPKSVISSLLKIDDLELDLQNFSVKRGNISILLSSKEFSLLSYLLRHQNNVLTKKQIISHVWNYDSDVLPNSVEVYIKHLRNKIDAPFPDRELIHTVRGFGYKISKKK